MGALKYLGPARMAADAEEATRAAMGFVLKRVSTYFRTVRYEWPNENGGMLFGPTFPATLQEWERACD